MTGLSFLGDLFILGGSRFMLLGLFLFFGGLLVIVVGIAMIIIIGLAGRVEILFGKGLLLISRKSNSIFISVSFQIQR